VPKLIPRRFDGYPHVGSHNWLIHGILIDFLQDAAKRYASGILVDIGCGRKPYQRLFSPYVSKHIGVDQTESPHGLDAVDIAGTAYDTGLPDNFADAVLSTEVLEHLEEPDAAVQEMHRILKPNGILILTVPLLWHVHEAPRDFYRYTQYGLRHLFEKGGFKIVELRALNGAIVTFSQLPIYVTKRFERIAIIGIVFKLFHWAIQHIASALRRFDGMPEFCCNYGMIARKNSSTDNGAAL
jgi:SAM-dependent methyltransferase